MNPKVVAIPGSLIRQVAAHRKSTTIDLGLGEPSLQPNPVHLERAMAYVREYGIKYTQNAGEPALRAAIARHYGYPGMREAENVCVTTGSQEAMYVTLKTILDPSTDALLVVEPTFPSYIKMGKLEGVSVDTVKMHAADGFAYDADRILSAVTERTRAIVICSPNNPTGSVIRRAEAERLVRGLEARPGPPVWIVHDEIYREQTFVDDPAYLAELYPHTIVTNSVSKSNALTGLRLGWILAPSAVVDASTKAHAWITSCADTFAQQVALDIFSTPEGVGEHVPWYRAQMAGVCAALDANGLQYIRPDGSFYACVRLPAGILSFDASMKLIEEYDVLAIPGSAFGECFEGWLRLSWVAPLDRVNEGARRIAAFLKNIV